MSEREKVKELVVRMTGCQARIALMCVQDGKSLKEAIEIALTH